MQNRYSSIANRVLAWTQTEAERLNQSQIEPEHLLLGLLREEKSIAYRVMEALRVDFKNLENELYQSLSLLPKEPTHKAEMSESIKRVLELSLQSTSVLGRPYLGTEHLLVGLMRAITNKAYPILRRAGVSYTDVLSKIKEMPFEGGIASGRRTQQVEAEALPVVPGEKLTVTKVLRMVSPVFWGLVGMTILMGMSAYNHWFQPGGSVFLFVTFGWLVSLSLHEFGHALVAYIAGDHSVINKGYLTLNPLKYTHGFLSVVLPLIYLAIGGIGLPGGAVYIDHRAIRNKRMLGLVSAAGPIMTGMFALILSTPFLLGLYRFNIYSHPEFWAGLAFLAFIQVTSLVFNLLPIPGFDGFGILSPYLPASIVNMLRSFGTMLWMLVLFIFLTDSPIGAGFWNLVAKLSGMLGISWDLIWYGFSLYKFWM